MSESGRPLEGTELWRDSWARLARAFLPPIDDAALARQHAKNVAVMRHHLLSRTSRTAIKRACHDRNPP